MMITPDRHAMSHTLSQQLKAATADLHRQAERSGVMAQLLRGRIDRAAYGRLLRSLLEIYQALEDGCRRHASHRLLAELQLGDLWRSDALRSDIDALRATGAAAAAPALEYADRLAQLSRDDPALLAAHAYVRYLGDLNGGQLLQPIVRSVLNLQGAEGTRFYQFDVPDASAHARCYRGVFDALALEPAAADAAIAEACWSFEQHIALFEELAAHTRSETWGS